MVVAPQPVWDTADTVAPAEPLGCMSAWMEVPVVVAEEGSLAGCCRTVLEVLDSHTLAALAEAAVYI